MVAHLFDHFFLPTCLCWVACLLVFFFFLGLSPSYLTSSQTLSSSTPLRWKIAGGPSSKTRQTFLPLFTTLFFFFLISYFPTSLTWDMTDIDAPLSYLTPKLDFSSIINVLVFCKVYSGKSKKSELFSIILRNKTKRSKFSGKTSNALFSIFYIHRL